MAPLTLLSDRRVVALDTAVERAATRLHGRPGVDRAAYLLSEVANHSVLWHAVNGIDAALSGGPRRRAALRRSVVLGLEQMLVNGPIKSLSKRDRPAGRAEHPHQLRTPLTSSFPSGHASAGACAATLLSADIGWAPLWWSLAAAVAWSRIHVGVHHASDVVAGAALGRALARSAAVVWPSPTSGRRTR